MSAMPPELPLSLYVHLPWCVKKCPYCDFNSHRADAVLPETAYVDALIRDLDSEVSAARGRPLVSIFFGGGTPSLFSPAAIGRILDAVRARLALTPDCEITLEANPGTVEQTRFEGYRAAGVNRLSLGIQSLDDAMLVRLGRIHGADEARAAVAAARAAGFDNINLDMMFALPQQTPAEAETDLRALIALAPEHISYYQLTLEPGTPFFHRPPAVPDGDRAADMHSRAQQWLAPADYTAYEVSAWARPGRRCAHNLNYWQFGDYLGIGAGAHGKFTDAGGHVWRRHKQPMPRRYQRGAGGPDAVAGERMLDAADQRFEFLMNALRLHDGFTPAAFEQRGGGTRAELDALLAAAPGMLEQHQGRVRCTALGAAHLDTLLERLLPDAA